MSVIYNEDLAKQNNVNITPTTTLDDVVKQCGTVQSTGSSIFALAGGVPANTGIMTVELASSTVYGPDPDWNKKRTDGQDDVREDRGLAPGAAGGHRHEQGRLLPGRRRRRRLRRPDQRRSSSGKAFGFFAPSGAAKYIMDAAGGHVTLVGAGRALAGRQELPDDQLRHRAGRQREDQEPQARGGLHQVLRVARRRPRSSPTRQGTIPIGSDINAADLLPQYQPVADQLDEEGLPHLRRRRAGPNPQVYDALGSGVTGLLTGQKTVDDVLKDMDAAWGN